MIEIAPPYIKIELATYQKKSSKRFGRELFEILWGNDKLLVPQRFGFRSNIELQKHLYTNLDDMVFHWPLDARYWHNSKKLKHYGMAHHTYTPLGWGRTQLGGLTFHAAYSNKIDWQSKFEKLCSLYQPDLAMMHLYTEFECRPENSTLDFRNASFGSRPFNRPTVPGLGWMLAISAMRLSRWKQLSRWDGQVRGLEIDGLDIKRTDVSGYTLLQLAKSDDEILDDFEAFQTRRNTLVARLKPLSHI